MGYSVRLASGRRDDADNDIRMNKFTGEAQDTAAAREEGDKTEPVEESRCWMG